MGHVCLLIRFLGKVCTHTFLKQVNTTWACCYCQKEKNYSKGIENLLQFHCAVLYHDIFFADIELSIGLLYNYIDISFYIQSYKVLQNILLLWKLKEK